MSRRNFILFIIVLIILTAITLGYFYFYQPSSPTDGGEVEDVNFLARFNPFSSSPTPQPQEPTGVEVTGFEPDTPTETEPGRLSKVSSMPVAGYSVFQKERYKEVVLPETPAETPLPTSTKPAPPETEFAPALRYVARTSGNIYQTFVDNIAERKFSSTIVPSVYEAYFGDKAETVVMRYLKADDQTIDTFVGQIPKEALGADTSLENEVRGLFLPPNVRDVSISPSNLKLFYLLKVGDNLIGTVTGLLDGKKTQIFDSPFTEWLPGWPNEKTITLTTKPASVVPGYMYTLDVASKRLTRVLSGINGLTVLGSPDGKLVLYSGNDLSLGLYNISSKSLDLISLRTLPEKCVWNKTSTKIYCAVPKSPPSALYPDSWYKGEVSFSDEIWEIDIASLNTQLIIDPISAVSGQEIDGIKLSLDQAEKHLFLVNKKDSYLWKLDL